MAVQCGWAAIDERGRASGGAAGDQTGYEVRLGSWYKFGQTEVFRWKDRDKAKKYAEIIKYWCSGNYVGYDQGQRITLGSWCKAHNWNYKVTTKVETDCSRMVADAINCTMKREVLPVTGIFWTGNMKTELMKTGLFTRYYAQKYLASDQYLMIGDIINNPSAHVISSLGTGSKAAEKTPVVTKKPVATIAKEVVSGTWGVEPQRTKKLKAAGYTDSEIKQIQKKVNKLLNKPKTTLKTGKVIAAQGLRVRNKPTTSGSTILRVLDYGTVVTCYATARGPGATLWWKISEKKAEYVSADWLY